ncbi:MAG: fumarylacetoacetate hydrolase family protein [Acidobacteriota bacterium]|nr:MAG: fumarylacetoacetate hydrolase family protein [Acidobacteriota bacterium]
MVQVSIGGERADVGTIYALGRNYAEHAREMGAAPEPVVFLKPLSSLRPEGGLIDWPEGSQEIHHEVELVLYLGRGGVRLDRAAAAAAIGAVGVGVDLTARDLQREAKQRGAPWARSKGFPGSAPVSAFVAVAQLPVSLEQIDLELTVGGELRQRAKIAEMLLSPAEIVALLSRWFELRASDLIFTGTPSGDGAVMPGEPVVARSRALDLELELMLSTRGRAGAAR